jgi:membrane-associated protein
MGILHTFFNFILHLDTHLVTFIATYGRWVYGILFLVIFCETGFVVTAFLPGDSLLFATGALTAKATGELNIHLLFIILFVASILGNTLNYLIGKFIGPRVFRSNNSIFLNKKHLERAHHFYKQYGGKTIIIARFIPIIRSFAPFVAGVGYMNYWRFTAYNLVGALLWVGSLLYISFMFGNLPFIRDHFSTIILAIIGVSMLPPVIEVLRIYLKAPNKAEQSS